jgi:tetratricopeptide (TPR) repeat protein
LLLEELEDETGAEEAYRKEVELWPGFVPAYLNLAVLLEKGNRYGEALDILRRALDQEPEAMQAEQIQSAVDALEKVAEKTR